jgi:hypothetical protein
LNKNLVERARNQKLNLSKVMENALTSILDYIEPQNPKSSSNFLVTASFLKEGVWCRGPDLNRRQPGLQPGALPS